VLESRIKKNLVFKKVNGDKIQFFVEGYSPIEVEVARNNNSAKQLLDIIVLNHKTYPLVKKHKNNCIFDIFGSYVASPELLYTLKMSHRFLKNSPHFKKTMDDILTLRKKHQGIAIPECLTDWFKLREKETYNYSHPKLNQKKDNFFNPEEIIYIFDHDSIHEAVSIEGAPAYKQIKEADEYVFCSQKKFETLDSWMQKRTVLEEAYTLALERHQIPNNFAPNPKASFMIALEKICTSIASGWWREYAWENYYQILEQYNEDYIVKFLKAYYLGNILPYKNEIKKINKELLYRENISLDLSKKTLQIY
jgi:hypothetical protein